MAEKLGLSSIGDFAILSPHRFERRNMQLHIFMKLGLVFMIDYLDLDGGRSSRLA